MATHKYGSDNYASLGEKIEDKFISLLINNGYKIRKATKEENIKSHNDLYISGYGCDVKDRKSTAIFVEYELGGRDGWIKSQTTTYISFHLSDLDQFYICKREDILKLFEEKKYRICGRKQYDEKLFVLPLADLKAITRKIM